MSTPTVPRETPVRGVTVCSVARGAMALTAAAADLTPSQHAAHCTQQPARLTSSSHLFTDTDLETDSDREDMSPKTLTVRPKYRESEFPGIEIVQIVDELRIIYSSNRESFSHFKEEYLETENKVFPDFVQEFLFILRNEFELPESPERFQAMVEQVVAAPVLHKEYSALMHEVGTQRFAWGLNDYAQMDLNGDGQISKSEIEARFGKSKKKQAKLLAKERTNDDHISLSEFIQCWDHVSKAKGKKKARKNKGFTHRRIYLKSEFPGVNIDDIAAELRQAYINNEAILENFKDEYAKHDNMLFREFVEELLFVYRNVSNLVPANEEQYQRLLERFLSKPVTYEEYCKILSLLPLNKFGWGIDSFAKLDLDSNGMITRDEIEAAFGKNKKKREKFEMLEKNKDGKISLAEFLHCWEVDPKTKPVPFKVMMVLTNNAHLGTTGRKTGYNLPELAHPYTVFKEAGLKVMLVSPRGGKAPMDPMSCEEYRDDLVCSNFIDNHDVQSALENTLNPRNIEPSDISCVFYVGGHGCLWDVARDLPLADITRQVYVSHGGLVAGISHGVAGLLPVTTKRASTPSILQHAKLTCFSNSEEEIIFGQQHTWEILPFKLEDRLKEKEAELSFAQEPLAPHVVSHKRLITGQNAASSTALAEKIVEELASSISEKKAMNVLI